MIKFDAFKKVVSKDSSFEKIYNELMGADKRDHSVLEKGYLFRGFQRCIPNRSLEEHDVHKMPCEGHFRRDKILTLVSADYYWPKLLGHVYVLRRCVVCDRYKKTLSNVRLHTFFY